MIFDIFLPMKGERDMIAYIEPVLYVDAQGAIPVCFCEQCGGECYRPRKLCPDCEERL